jgi:hypothetical protein
MVGRLQFEPEELVDIMSHFGTTSDCSKYFYVGQWKPNSKIKDGIGLWIWNKPVVSSNLNSEFSVYEGYLKDDKAHGLGKHIYSNGDVYEGRYRHNKK